MPASAKEIQRWKAVEAECARGNAKPHPDACPKIIIRSVAWTVPPNGTRIVPTFGEGGVTLSAGEEQTFPSLEAVRNRPEGRTRYCPSCGQSVGTDMELMLDNAEHAAWLGAVIGLAAELLKARYTLTDGVLAELLAFEPGEFPEWAIPVYRWAIGSGPYSEDHKFTDWTYEMPEQEPQEPGEPVALPWWRRVLRRVG